MTSPTEPPAPAPSPIDDGGHHPPGPAVPTTVLWALYRLLLRSQLTRGKLILVGVMGAMAILLAALIGADAIDDRDRLEAIVGSLWFFGLGLMVPILCLVLSTSALGQLVEDEILVYLWLRPIPRWVLALAAWLSAATVAIPLTVLPLTVATAVGTRLDPTATAAMAASVAMASLVYSALFVLLGLVVRRSLIVGMIYVFIWEFFVARVGQGAARLSINTYPSSILARMTDVELPLADRLMSTAIITPIVVAIVAVAITGWWLNRTDVA